MHQVSEGWHMEGEEQGLRWELADSVGVAHAKLPHLLDERQIKPAQTIVIDDFGQRM